MVSANCWNFSSIPEWMWFGNFSFVGVNVGDCNSSAKIKTQILTLQDVKWYHDTSKECWKTTNEKYVNKYCCIKYIYIYIFLFSYREYFDIFIIGGNLISKGVPVYSKSSGLEIIKLLLYSILLKRLPQVRTQWSTVLNEILYSMKYCTQWSTVLNLML